MHASSVKPSDQPLSDAERRFLDEAAAYLESPTFLVKIANLVGKPAEVLLSSLPERARSLISDGTSDALEKGLDWAVRSLADGERSVMPAAVQATTNDRPVQSPIASDKHALARATGNLLDTARDVIDSAKASGAARFVRRHRHTALTALTGAGGGMFGLPGLAVELPATTMLMLRSIASIAAEHGADLSDPTTRLECLAVFSLGSQPLEEMESAYLTTRLSLAMAVRQASQFLAVHTAREVSDALTKGTAPMLMRLINTIAARFQVVVSEKVAAQTVPLLGAGLGALINAAFTDHFNRVANYHFAIVELERRYGRETVQTAYENACRLRRLGRAPRTIVGQHSGLNR